MTAGSDFRTSYEADYEAETPADALVLDRVCALLDAIQKMEATVETDGMTVTGGNGQVAQHPLLTAIRAHGDSVARLVRQLGMEGPETKTTKNARAAANARWSGQRNPA